MSNNPDDIRADIDRTRAALGRDVDALAEKTDPSKVMDRQTDKIRGKWTQLRESVMGSADDHDYGSDSTMQDARERAGELADEAGQRAKQAPQEIKQRTRGNPLAAGMIALGAGWLIGSLLPASKPEQDLATTAKEKAEPAIEEAKSVAQDMGDHLQPQAKEAAESVTDSARSGVEHVKSEGQHHVADIKNDAQDAAKNVRDTAQDS
ncbi:DUF3618 domain-containing protein [Corynebacterium halotolerans]|uniref:DUF3618 domain-containing protein n=1 Tax=Corynebacterium halotolerans TaxID=225326 RepID=UPI003CF09717